MDTEKEQRAVGRPSIYTPELARELCRRLAEGRTLRSVCRDEDYLIIGKDGKKLGTVYLVYGNDGWDVISDYSVSLEYLMVDAQKVSDKYAA